MRISPSCLLKRFAAPSVPARPIPIPITPPKSDRTIDSMMNCSGDVAAISSDRFANPNLAGAFGDRDEHDVHDADAGNHQRDATDGRQADADDAQDGLERLQLIGGVLSDVFRASAVDVLELGYRRLSDGIGVQRIGRVDE